MDGVFVHGVTCYMFASKVSERRTINDDDDLLVVVVIVVVRR